MARQISYFTLARVDQQRIRTSRIGLARGDQWYQRMPTESTPQGWEIIDGYIQSHGRKVLASVRVDGAVSYRVFNLEQMPLVEVKREESESCYVPPGTTNHQPLAPHH
jgi:hypothetical protein